MEFTSPRKAPFSNVPCSASLHAINLKAPFTTRKPNSALFPDFHRTVFSCTFLALERKY